MRKVRRRMPGESDRTRQVREAQEPLLHRRRLDIEETQGTLISDSLDAILTAINDIEKTRRQLQEYLRKNPKFQHSLKPVPPTQDAPQIAVRMAEAAYKANVGPMATVAGALIDLAFEQMKEAGAKTVIIENGGEVVATSPRPIYAGVWAGPSPISGKIALKLSRFPVAVATSSASVSHAFTFGSADAATIVADNASLADAAATAVCNAVQGVDVEGSVREGLSTAEKIEGVKAAIVIRGRYIGSTGDVPEMVAVRGDISPTVRTAVYL